MKKVIASSHCRPALPVFALLLCVIWQARAANIGTVNPIIGQVADLAYDPQRSQVYMANASEGAVDIYSVGAQTLLPAVQVGSQPVSLALSPDLQQLYVANAGSLTISVIDLNS